MQRKCLCCDVRVEANQISLTSMLDHHLKGRGVATVSACRARIRDNPLEVVDCIRVWRRYHCFKENVSYLQLDLTSINSSSGSKLLCVGS